MLYIHDYDNWWKFRYDSLRVMNELGRVRSKQGMIIGRMLSLGFDSQDNAVLSNISMELVRSSEIEGEKLNLGEVRSSLARRLGIAMAGMVSASRYVEGVVEMQLDATQNYNHPLSADRLFGWHNVLFPTGISGLYRIEVGKYRSGEMATMTDIWYQGKKHYLPIIIDHTAADERQRGNGDNAEGINRASCLVYMSLYDFGCVPKNQPCEARKTKCFLQQLMPVQNNAKTIKSIQ